MIREPEQIPRKDYDDEYDNEYDEHDEEEHDVKRKKSSKHSSHVDEITVDDLFADFSVLTTLQRATYLETFFESKFLECIP